MAFNRRSEPSRGMVQAGDGSDGGRGVAKKRTEGTRSPGITPIKTPPWDRGFIKYFTEERQVTGEITFAFEHVQARISASYIGIFPPCSAVHTVDDPARPLSPLSQPSILPAARFFCPANIFLVGQLYITGHAR